MAGAMALSEVWAASLLASIRMHKRLPWRRMHWMLHTRQTLRPLLPALKRRRPLKMPTKQRLMLMPQRRRRRQLSKLQRNRLHSRR